MVKILVCDRIDEDGIKTLRSIGETEVAIGLPKDELLKKIQNVDAVVVRSATKVTADLINAAQKLKVIARAGVGVDNIDVPAATRKGILVINAPDSSSIAVAEHVIGLMLALTRKIAISNMSLKSGKWEKGKFLGVELSGKLLGIIGLGRIGTQVALRAKALGLRVAAFDPYVTEKAAEELGIKLVDLETLLKESDIITIHVPLTPETKYLIGEKQLSLMKSNAFLINTSRGGVVNEKALCIALKGKKIAGAALDVFEAEPPIENPLLELENVVVTPHIGGSTEEAQRSAAMAVASEIINVLQGKPVRNVVNIPIIDPETLRKLEPFLPLAEKLGRFATQLSEGRITEVHITYCGELVNIGQLNLLTSTLLKGLLDRILTQPINVINAPFVAKSRGIKVIESKTEVVDHFPNEVILKVKAEKTEIEVKGTLLGKEPRVISIDEYKIDLPLDGRIVLVSHLDRPGMIGKIASVFGEHSINIATMQVGRKEPGGIQLMVLKIDHPMSEPVLKALKHVDGIKDVDVAEMEV